MPSSWGDDDYNDGSNRQEGWSDEDNDDTADQEAPLQEDDDFYAKQQGANDQGEERSPSPFSSSQEQEKQNDLPWYRRRKVVMMIALLVLLGLAVIIVILTRGGNDKDDASTTDRSNNNNNTNNVFGDKTSAPSLTTTPTAAPSFSATTTSPNTTNGGPPSTTTTSIPTIVPTMATAIPTKTVAPTNSAQPSQNDTTTTTTAQPTLAPSSSFNTTITSPPSNFTNGTATVEPVNVTTVSPTSTLTNAPTLSPTPLPDIESWEPLGQTLQGNTTNERFGHRVDLSTNGRILAVQGGTGDDDDLNTKVRVFEYHVETAEWHVLGQDLVGRMLGNVAVHETGKTLALRSGGVVQFFRHNGITGEWERQGDDIVEMEGGAIAEGDVLVALSANGKRAVTASHLFDSTAGTQSGRARVFQWTDTSSSWEQVGQDILGDVEMDRFGTAVAISSDGSFIAVAASLSSNAGYSQITEAGYVRVFRNIIIDDATASSSSWEEVMTINGRQEGIRFGLEVALSSNARILAMRTSEDVKVFQYAVSPEGFESWTRLGRDLIPSDDCDSWSGSLDLSSNGRTLAIGVTGCQVCTDGDICIKSSGGVVVYGLKEEEGDQDPKWEQIGLNLRLTDDSPHSLSLSGDGRSVAICASETETDVWGVIHPGAGSVAVYEGA